MTVNYRYVKSIIRIGKNKPINKNQSVTSITKLIPCSCTNECNLILSCITQKRFEKLKLESYWLNQLTAMATFNVRGMYKYISLPHIMQVWLDGMNMNISFSKIELINTKINSSLRKFFVKYTLIQYHFRFVSFFYTH